MSDKVDDNMWVKVLLKSVRKIKTFLKKGKNYKLSLKKEKYTLAYTVN